MAKPVQVAVRLEAETVQLAAEVAKLSPVPLSQAAIMRAAIERGLEVLRAEFQASKPKGKRK